MPKNTFFNLPEEKRQTIIGAALDEFSTYGYGKSNMNRIVEISGIAKGSFYQYFEDKKDLYYYLVDTMGRRKLDMLAPAFEAMAENSFSRNLEEIFRIGIEFADSDPKFYKIGQDFASPANGELMAGFLEKYQVRGTNIYMDLLTAAQKRGELHDDVDLPLAAGMVAVLISQTTVMAISQSSDKESRDRILAQLVKFVERALQKHAK
ncbi:MAG TPA: TetR/AcrR family transcriptional regulator [Pseudoflavonifractor sp.]|jgi:AcrR family transcriptional regulator|nr:TetR/AcrR family transcriptional regulator [Pseudoflavonifractor sp.]